MSGGSMYYLYLRVRDATFHTNSPEREAFRKHLMLVANALRSIEWNDSGDGDDQEVPNIMACIALSAEENELLRAEIERLRAEVQRHTRHVEQLYDQIRRRADERDKAQIKVERLREALTDMLAGWRYIREAYGDLAGIGWDRAEQKAREALDGKP